MSNRGGLLTIPAAAKRLGENIDLVDHIPSNPDNVDYGDLTHLDDGSADGATVITARGIESVEELLADIRTWPGRHPPVPYR